MRRQPTISNAKSIGSAGASGRSLAVAACAGFGVDTVEPQDALDDAPLMLGAMQTSEDVAAARCQQPHQLAPRELSVPVDEGVLPCADSPIDVSKSEGTEADSHAIDEQIEVGYPPPIDGVRRHLTDHEPHRVRDDAHRVDFAELLRDEVVALADVVDHAVEHFLRERLFARHVVVEGAEADVGSVGDLLDRRGVDALRGHELDRPPAGGEVELTAAAARCGSNGQSAIGPRLVGKATLHQP